MKMMDLNDLQFYKFKCKHPIQLLRGGYSGILSERESGLKLQSIPRNEERERDTTEDMGESKTKRLLEDSPWNKKQNKE